VTRERKAQIVTLAVLGAAVAGIVVFKRSPAAPPPKPQDAVYRMLDAARDGDVKKYLTAYTGQMEASLKQAVAESGEAAFARYLKDSNAAIKGVAGTLVISEDLAPQAVQRLESAGIEYRIVDAASPR
jgi:predicted transcriptional regulator